MPDMSNRASSRLLLGAVVVSAVGDLLFSLYVAWTLATTYDSIMAAAGVIATSVLFRALVAFLSGSLIDRVNKRLLCVGANIGCIVVLSIFALLGDQVMGSVVLVTTLVVANNVFNELFTRAYVVSASLLLPEDRFLRFQARTTIGLRVVATVGAALAGWLISTLTQRSVVLLDIASFVLAAALCAFVKPPTAPREHPPRRITPWTDLVMVARRISRDTYLRSFVLLMLVLNLAYGFVPLLFPLVLAREHSSALDLGWLRAGIAVGEIVGLVIMERLAIHVGALFRASMIGCGLAVFLAGLGFPLAVGVALLALYGAFDSLSQPLFSHTVMQIDPAERGRVLGGIDGLILLTPSLGILIGSRLAEMAVWSAGLFIAVAFLAGLVIVMSVPSLRSVRKITTAEEGAT